MSVTTAGEGKLAEKRETFLEGCGVSCIQLQQPRGQTCLCPGKTGYYASLHLQSQIFVKANAMRQSRVRAVILLTARIEDKGKKTVVPHPEGHQVASVAYKWGRDHHSGWMLRRPEKCSRSSGTTCHAVRSHLCPCCGNPSRSALTNRTADVTGRDRKDKKESRKQPKCSVFISGVGVPAG